MIAKNKFLKTFYQNINQREKDQTLAHKFLYWFTQNWVTSN